VKYYLIWMEIERKDKSSSEEEEDTGGAKRFKK
jgi:hypothetical protein